MILPQLAGKNIVVYDLETKHDPTIKGWHDYAAMGISMGAAYDYETGDYIIYFEDNMPYLVERLNRAELVVGFNNVGFDNNLLRGCGYALRDDLPNLDLLDISRRALGWVPGMTYPKGCKLDNHLEAHFGERLMKTGHGAYAFVLYAQGKMGELTTYGLSDARRERLLFEDVLVKKVIKTVMHGERECDISHLIPPRGDTA